MKTAGKLLGTKQKMRTGGQLNDEAGGQGEDEDPGEDVRVDVSHSKILNFGL
jgi:hypothetical protein